MMRTNETGSTIVRYLATKTTAVIKKIVLTAWTLILNQQKRDCSALNMTVLSLTNSSYLLVKKLS